MKILRRHLLDRLCLDTVVLSRAVSSNAMRYGQPIGNAGGLNTRSMTGKWIFVSITNCEALWRNSKPH